MRILDMLKRSTTDAFRKRELLLDESAPQHWPRLLVEHFGLDAEFKRFTSNAESIKEQCRKSTRAFTDEDVLAAIPERARTINAIHGKEYAQQIDKLLGVVTFPDIFKFEAAQAAYFEANSNFKDTSTKHTAVLREFMHDELKATQACLQQLEDAVIGFMKTLEDHKFPVIRKLYDANLKLQQMQERQEKYGKLQASLATDLKHTQEKRRKIEEEIKAQQALVRNEQALASLQKMHKLEEELFHTAEQYQTLAKELHTLYNKHPDLKMTDAAKKAVIELQKDHTRFLTESAETVKKGFADIAAQLEEESLQSRPVIERLTRLAGAAEADGRKMATSAPDIRLLKRDVMKDVAALQMYDKQQFLLRAQAEERNIQRKLDYLASELDPNKRIALEREMKDAAKSLGALIKAKTPETVVEIEEPEIEPEHEDAALK